MVWWPVQFFYNILDLAAINAHILYKLVTASKISRRRYLLQLSEELRSRFVEEGKVNSHESTITNSSMQKSRKRKHCKVKAALTKHVKRAAVALSLFGVNALENKKNSFTVKFAANKYCSCCVLSCFFVAMHAVLLQKLCQNFEI